MVGDAVPEIILAAQQPLWLGAGNRSIAQRSGTARRLRGDPAKRQLFVVGGVGDNANPEATGVYLPEDHVPAINWSTGQYTTDTGSWANVPQSEAANPIARSYHSVALLMPDGRVWTAGSTDNAGLSLERNTIEIYEPDYLRGPRPHRDL